MSAPTTAPNPTAYVTEIPGRFVPAYVISKRNLSAVTTDTGTTLNAVAFLPRAETVDASFNTPVTLVDELGTDFHVGAYDDLPETKVSLQCYDVGYTVISLITGKQATPSAVTTYGFQDFNTAEVDLIRQYADPNGNVFASSFQSNLVVDEFGFSLKQKSVAMESYSLSGFNMMKFRGYIETKAVVATGAGSHLTGGGAAQYGLDLSTVLGTDEMPVEIPQPTGSQVPTYWAQNGHIYFLKIERWSSATGVMTQFTETTVTGNIAPGVCKWDVTDKQLWTAEADIVDGDVWLLTFCTYGCDATSVGGVSQSYKQIYGNTPDTSDAIAVPTRLTPFTISANDIARGQSLDVKMSLKRERAEGIGDVSGLFGPSAAPEVSVSFEVKATDFGLYAILETGSPLGSGNGGSSTGDFYDPNAATRNQISNPTVLAAEILDPRYASAILKTYHLPAMVLSSEDGSTSTKNAMTLKYSGIDQTGNMTIIIDRTQSNY